MVTLTRLDSTQPDFAGRLTRLLQVDGATDAAIENTVEAILADVKTHGDAAVLEYTARFDKLDVASMTQLDLPAARLHQALDELAHDLRQRIPALAGYRAQAAPARDAGW